MPSESIAAIVIIENLTCHRACHHMTTILGSDTPIMNPETIAAARIPEPVAESQLKPNTAGSGVGFATTGETRSTILFSPVIGICGLVNFLGDVCRVLSEGNIFSGVFITLLPV